LGSIRVIVGGSDTARAQAIAEYLQHEAGTPIHYSDTTTWAFTRTIDAARAASGPLIVVARHLHDAFPGGQTGGTRCVLTQSGYQLQRWLDWMERRGDVSLVADADDAALRRTAPEAFQRRGPWARMQWIDLEVPESETPRDDASRGLLWRAFMTADPNERLALCRRHVDAHAGDAVAQLALASALMEVQDLDACEEALARALAVAPDWEAAHYERGKLWMRRDDLERASQAFAEAARLMPSFSTAFSNLGATLGELDRPEEALAAFRHALQYDPEGHTILNNIGVVSRELGRLAESESAFRKVVALAPEFVFGHYNLGHTLFLQGRYQAALSAYAEGQRRDPEKNARQACRLAVVRLAAGDPDGSLRDLARCTANVARDEKREILAEAQEILWALLTDQPALPGWRRVADAVKAQLDTLG
jgi:tetratricopeptide (TPR) repeat protein